MRHAPRSSSSSTSAAAATAHGFAPLDLTQLAAPPAREPVVSKLPSVRVGLSKAVGVQLPHEGREVGVLEALGEEVARELGGLPDDEASGFFFVSFEVEVV